LGFILAIFGLIYQWYREEKRKPNLSVKLERSIHGHRTEYDPWIEIRPDVKITNRGELQTAISEVRVEGVPFVRLAEPKTALIRLKEPIKIEGKDIIFFKDPIIVEGTPFFVEDCKLSLTFYSTEGHPAKSNIVVSCYYEILTPSTNFRRPTR